MSLTMQQSKQELLIKWFEECSNFSSEQYSVFLRIIDIVQNDLSVFYKMNEILDDGSGVYEHTVDNAKIVFKAQDNRYCLESTVGSIELDYYAFKTIISKIVDIYTDIYPLGTVVELNKEKFNAMIPLNIEDQIRVVIIDRLEPVSEALFFSYIGLVYPISNFGRELNSLRFDASTIDKVIHMGYSDNEDISYVNERKKEFIVDLGMHSTSIMTNEEMELFRQKNDEGTINN